MEDITEILWMLCLKYHKTLKEECVWQIDTLLGVVWKCYHSDNREFYVAEQLFGNGSNNISPSQREERIFMLLEELHVVYERLADEGVTKEKARQMLWEQERVSRIDISRKGVVLLIDSDIEVKLSPLQWAVYVLFLRHNEGIAIKQMIDYTDELTELMVTQQRGSGVVNISRIKRMVERLTNPTNGAMNEVVSKIRYVFCHALGGDDSARHYYINGTRNSRYSIPLQREFVVWT